jgi:hypothetical protein
MKNLIASRDEYDITLSNGPYHIIEKVQVVHYSTTGITVRNGTYPKKNTECSLVS